MRDHSIQAALVLLAIVMDVNRAACQDLPPAGQWSRSPVVAIPKLDAMPKIDGAIDAIEWVGAAQLPPMLRDREGVLDTERTQVIVAYTDQAIVFAWRVHRSYDGPMALVQHQPGPVDGRAVWLDDAVELFLDIHARGDQAVAFAGNAAGAYGDGLYQSQRTDFAPSWTWRYAATIVGQHWEAELALPFSALDLPGPPPLGEVWGFDIQRVDKQPNLLVSTLTRSNRELGRYARLRFAGSVPVFRVLEAGPVGDQSMGMVGELVNLTDADQAVDVTSAVYRQRDGSAALDFFAEFDAGMDDNVAGTDDVAAMMQADQQMSRLLDFYEPVAVERKKVTVTAGGRQPVAALAHPVPVGRYVIAWRVEDADGRVISSAMIPAQRWEPLRVEVVPYFIHGRIEAKAYLYSAVLTESTATLRAELRQGDTVLAVREVGKDALGQSIMLDAAGLEGGTYQVVVSALGSGGQRLSTTEYVGYRPKEPPHWLTSKDGMSRFVPQPWTPVEAGPDKASVWGRAVHMGDQALPLQIVSQGQPLWTSAPRLRLAIDGLEVAWRGQLRLVEHDPEYADYEWVGRAGDLPVRALMRVEFDGLITIDLEMETDGARIDSFLVEFPFQADQAQMYSFNWSRYGPPRESTVPTAGRLRQPFATGFKYAYWLGMPARGLQWMAESNAFWFSRKGRAIEVVPGEHETVLRLRVIDEPIEAPPKLHYRWGLMPSPVRPYDQPRRYASDLFVAQLSVPRTYYTGDPKAMAKFHREVAQARAMGANWIMTFHWLNRYPPPFGPDTFGELFLENPQHIEAHRQVVKLIHDRGMKTAVYTGWNGMHPKMSDYPHYGEAMKRVPTRFTFGGFKPCMNGGFADYQAGATAWAVRTLGVDGVYLDGTAVPQPCANPGHGCGFVHPKTGKRMVTYNLWAHRELFKRMYKILHREVTHDGLIYSHSGGAPLLAIESFVDIRHTAEGVSKEHLLDLEGFVPRYDGRLIGVPVELTRIHGTSQNMGWGIVMLHDAAIKMYADFFASPNARARGYQDRGGIDWRAWIARQWFDWNANAAWHPYYVNHDLLSVDVEHVKASFHINDKQQILFLAMNVAEEDGRATFKFDRDALDLPARLYARDVVTDATFEIIDGRLTLDFASLRPRWLMIAPDPVARPDLDLEIQR